MVKDLRTNHESSNPDAVLDGGCVYPEENYNCDGDCIGVNDDPNTADVDESLACGCADGFAANYEAGVLNDWNLCDYTGRYPATWTINTPGAYADEARQLLCLDEVGSACYSNNNSNCGLDDSLRYALAMHLVDGATYYMFLSLIHI